MGESIQGFHGPRIRTLVWFRAYGKDYGLGFRVWIWLKVNDVFSGKLNWVSRFGGSREPN